MRLPGPKVMEARTAFRDGDFGRATKLLTELARENPNDGETHFRLGLCHFNRNRLVEARASMERASKLMPGQPDIWCGLASLSRREGKIAKAQREVERALEANPAHEPAIKLKAELRYYANDAEGACRVLDEAERAGVRSFMIEMAFGLFCASVGRTEEGARRLEAIIDLPEIPSRSRATSLFRLGVLYDKMGQHDRAWETFVRANEMRKPRFNPVMLRASFERLTDGWNAESVGRAGKATRSGERFVFIVGMPRSGTSLVEQIIASHPKAYGAGELSDLIYITNELGLSDVPGSGHVHHPERLSKLAADDAARRYHQMAASLSPGATRFTDKNPFNFQNVGVTQLLFPGSKVVWCRRNPIDVCASIYFQDFEDSIPFASNLGHIAMMCREVERIMLHWQRLFPGQIMELHYDDLVDRQEEKTRELLSFIGLSWDEACLKFYESARITVTASNDQVRKPLYKSTGRYAPYEKYLVQLRKDLGLPPAP